MSDVKKVTVTSVPTHEGEKKKPKKKRTVRLILTLSESNEKTCPEFNYGDLLSQHLNNRLGNHRLGDIINGPAREKGDPYASDEDEALKALARSFEKKYGGGAAGGPKRKKRKKENDFKQLGEGYDENDPFIDNSDAIDDVLPTNVETKFGGFYINSGELNFEEVQVSEDEKTNDSQVQNLKRKRKNEIVSSDEEGGGEEEEVEEKEGIENGEKSEGECNGEDEKIRENGILKIKKRKLDEGEMLRKRKKMIDKFNAKKQKLKGETSENEADLKMEEAAEPVEQNEVKTNSEGTSIAACIEAVVTKARESANMQEEIPIENNNSNNRKEKEDVEEEEEEDREDSSSDSSSSSSSSDSSSSESESEDEKEDKESDKEHEKKEEEEGTVKNDDACASNDNDADHLNNASDDNEKDSVLPADLPQDLIAVLDKLKEEGKNTKTSSQKFFTDSVNKKLLSIEVKLGRYGGRKKNLIYNHLSHHLPCGTQTLLKRAKNLLVEKLDERLKLPMQRLKEALDKTMPKLLEAHALECQKIAEDKGEDKEDRDEEEALDQNKKTKLPRKKFEFTPELRELLCDVVRVRCQGWHMIKKRSETAEEHAKSFIETTLKSLWPKGWITTKLLYKESQSAHALITEKNSMKIGMVKKVTVLGGGTVSNANPTSSNLATETPSANSENDVDKAKVPSIEAEKTSTEAEMSQEVEPKSVSSSLGKPDVKGLSPSESTLKIINIKPPEEKATPLLTKLTSTKILETTPPKDPVRSGNENPLPSISPISESSQKSFHGFESPIKVPEGLKGIEEASSRQALFDSSRKPLKNTLDSSHESLPPVRQGKPPKPSLTATALPKISIASSISISKGEDLKKGFSEHIDIPKTVKDDRKTITCITIKSVEKINEAVNPISKSSKERDRSKNVEKEREPPKKKLIPSENFGVIDLATDDESEQSKKIENTPTSASVRSVPNVNNKGVSRSVNNGSNSSVEPHNKLQQEMDQVMNAILHISKKNQQSNDFEGPVNKLDTHSVVSANSSTCRSVEKHSLSHSQSHQQTKVSPTISPQSNFAKTSTSNNFESSKPSMISISNPSKNSTYSADVVDVKNYHKHSFAQPPQKIPDIITSKHQSSHSSNPQYTSASNIQRVSPSVSSPHNLQLTSQISTSNANKTLEDGSKYQSSYTSSHTKPKQEFYNRAMLSGSLNQSSNLDGTSDSKSAQRSLFRNSSQLPPSAHSDTKSHNTNNSMQQSRSDQSSSVGPLDLHKPSTHSGNLGTSSSSTVGNFSSPLTQGGHRSSLSSNNENHKLSTSNHSGSHHPYVSVSGDSQQAVASIYGGSRRISPSIHGESLRTSSHNESQRTSPSTPKTSQQIAVVAQSEGLRLSSSSLIEPRQISPSSYGESHRVSPSTQSGSHRASPSAQFGSHHRSPSSHSGSHRTSPSTHRTSPSTHSSGHRSSPSTQSGSYRSSTSSVHGGNHRTSPLNHSESHRTSPSKPRESSKSSYLSGVHRPSSPRRTPPIIVSSSQSQNKSHNIGHRLPNSQNGNQSSLPALQGGSPSFQPSQRNSESNFRKENLSTEARNHVPSISASRSLQIGHSSASQNSSQSSSHSSSRSSRQPSDVNPSSYMHHNVPSRPSKPSHNVDSFLYNNSSSSSSLSSKTPSVSVPHSNYSPVQSSAQKSEAKVSHVESSWNREPSVLASSKALSMSKKPTESSSYSTSGNGSYLLSNVHLRDGLSVSSSAKTSHSVSLYTSSSNSGSSRLLGSSSSQRSSLSSVQPKIKQRSDPYSLSAPHPLLANMTSEQQQDLWQQMNAGAYLPSADVYKYMSQQGLYQQSTNKSEGSSKKSSQI